MSRGSSSTICALSSPQNAAGYCSRVALIAVLSVSASQLAWAQTTIPNPLPTPPPSVVTSLPALSTVGAGGCAKQYTAAINHHADQANIAQDSAVTSLGIGAAAAVTNATAQAATSATNAAAFTALSVGLAGTAAYGTSPLPNFEGIPFSVDAAAAAGVLAGSSTAKSVAWGAAVVGAAASVAGVASQATAQVFRQEAQALTNYIATLPNCESTFTGTVKVAVPAGQGALNVSGDSIFSGSVGVTEKVDVGGNVTASELLATRGISAAGGNIVLGNPDLTTFATGINIGGGAIAGAGAGGGQASTGDTSAIAIGNLANAVQANATALGTSSTASGLNATAVGFQAQANADFSTSVGSGNNVTGQRSSAFGADNVITGANSGAFGTGNTVDGDGSYAFGHGARVTASSAVALGQGSIANQANTISVGALGAERRIVNVAAGTLSETSTDAVNGNQLFATNQNVANIPIRANNMSNLPLPSAGGVDSLAVGFGANAAGANSTATGEGAQATGNNSSAFGRSAAASGNNSMAVGSGANATGTNASAYGVNSLASGAASVAIGSTAQATQAGAVAIGQNAASTGLNAIAIGTGATAAGSVAVGARASAANGGAAFGDDAVATGVNATAVGPGASATFANSTALSKGASTTRANQVAIGTTANTYTLAGLGAAAVVRANPHFTRFVTTDADGNLGVASFGSTLGDINGSLDSLNNRMDAADARLDNLDNRVSALGQFARDSRHEARRGIVASAATAAVMMPSGPGRTTVNIKAAGYRGEAGVGITFAHRLNTTRPVVLNAGYSNGGGREHIGHAGMGFEF